MTTTPVFDWLAFTPYLEEAAAAFEANSPLPPASEMSMADAVAALKAAEPDLAKLDTWFKANPGAVTAVLIILKGLQAQGVGWASELSAIVSGAPGGLAAAEGWIPGVISAMAIISPAPDAQVITGGSSPYHGR